MSSNDATATGSGDYSNVHTKAFTNSLFFGHKVGYLVVGQVLLQLAFTKIISGV